jgi:hypothetical protein
MGVKKLNIYLLKFKVLIAHIIYNILLFLYHLLVYIKLNRLDSYIKFLFYTAIPFLLYRDMTLSGIKTPTCGPKQKLYISVKYNILIQKC